MKKINVEATKLNNEDVIATSEKPCDKKYHLEVQVAYPDSEEICYLYKWSEDLGDYTRTTEKPTEITGTMDENSLLHVELGNNPGIVYYWNGSAWVNCDNYHPN